MTGKQGLRGLLGLAVFAALLGCGASQTPVSPLRDPLAGTALEGCCQDAEQYPDAVIAIADPIAPLVGRVVGNIVMRPGYLETARAQRAILADLKPLDLVVNSSKGRLSGAMLPGLFGHVMIYTGSEADLRRLGVWDHPSVVPHQAAVRAGKWFIEADSHGVHLSTPAKALETDSVAILRPRLSGPARRAEVEIDLMSRIGTCFDFKFDNGSTDQIYCAELARQSMPDLGLPERLMYGRQSTLPEDIVTHTAVRRAKLDLVAYYRGSPSGYQKVDRATLIADLRNWWQKADRPMIPPPTRPLSCDGGYCPLPAIN